MCSLISHIYPARNKELLEELQKKKATVIGETNKPSSADRVSLASFWYCGANPA